MYFVYIYIHKKEKDYKEIHTAGNTSNNFQGNILSTEITDNIYFLLFAFIYFSNFFK